MADTEERIALLQLATHIVGPLQHQGGLTEHTDRVIATATQLLAFAEADRKGRGK